MKRRYADKWSTDVLEQIAVSCNVATKAESTSDWELFLNAIYEAAIGLPTMQRAVLLLSQEHALSFADIGRALNLPHSTVVYNLGRAVDKIVGYLQSKSLVDITVRQDSRVSEVLYCGRYIPEENNAHTRFGFYHDHEPPWFYAGENILLAAEDDGLVGGEKTGPDKH